MIQKVSTALDFLAREKEVIKFWNENDIFQKSMKNREGHEVWSFYDGPPTANGKPHIGHIETRAIKDLLPRYHTMKGQLVTRKAGWDTHGLPVELEVERMLGLDGKEQIEEYGIEPFIQECKKSVWKYKGEWERMSERVGFWADMENPYITYDNDYIESVWWSLKQIADKGLLYKGHKVVPYCPRCGTALSSHEVSQGYKEVRERSAVVRFKVKGEENTWIYAWTTTPWTLPSNVALCVNPDETYAKFDYDGRTIIMGDALIEKVLGEGVEVQNKTTFPGSELKGLRYEPLFDFQREAIVGAENEQNAWVVVCDDYVTMTDGTGVVHQAPAFGEDDARVGRENHIPFLQLVDAKGEMTKDTYWPGVFVKKADPMILEWLEEQGKLVDAPWFTHEYPFCWRCDTPLIYYARSTWFIRMTAVRDRLVANNRTVNWYPDNIKEGRFGNFLENVIDWGLSRERYWGTPLPVWVCKCGKTHVIGSRAELKELGKYVPKAVAPLPTAGATSPGESFGFQPGAAGACPSGSSAGALDDIELHRPYIDAVTLTCPDCGGEMRRTPEVIDCWYDSGSMPFAQWHYPFENQEIFEANFPANFISEAIDQTRGWFYTLMAISTLLFDCSPFQNCVVMGHVQDAEGKKMSKHLGNVVNPWDVLDKQGADAVRWYFYANGAPWLPTRFSGELVSEMQSKFMGTLWNTYAFFCMYASIDDYRPDEHKADPADLTLMDRWVLSRLNSLVKTVDEGMAQYRITESARAIQAFVEELSNWYVRLSKGRFWGKEWTGDKKAAYETLYTVLVTLCKLAAPFIPFMTESMYQNLVASVVEGAPESVHLCDYPVCDESKIDRQLEAEMDEVAQAVTLGRACRNTANIKVRQALSTLYVKGAKLSDACAALIRDELNVENVEFIDDARAFTSYQIKPQMKTVGPKYGRLLNAIKTWLAGVDGNAFVDALEKEGAVKFDIDGNEVSLTAADCLIAPAQKPGFVAETERDMTVVIDTNLTPELIEKGFVREVVSKLQTMRKEAGFDVVDRITVTYRASETLAPVIAKNAETISAAVLATALTEGDAPADAYAKEWNINGEKAMLAVRRNG